MASANQTESCRHHYWCLPGFATQIDELHRQLMMLLAVAIPIELESTKWLVVASPIALEMTMQLVAANQTDLAAVASEAASEAVVQLAEVAANQTVAAAVAIALAIAFVAAAASVDFVRAIVQHKEDRSSASAIAGFPPLMQVHQLW